MKPTLTKSVSEILVLASGKLPTRPGIPDPAREAALLLAAAWSVRELDLRLEPDKPLPSEVEDRFRQWLDRRVAGEPLEHLTGRCSFWGRQFAVSPEVLVPRPETEYLIQAALELDLPTTARVLDVGCGSGAIAVTLAAERPKWRVTAVDISDTALRVAQSNAADHASEVLFLLSDLGSAVHGDFDVVAANLPYIPTDRLAELPVEVSREPRGALDGGGDGLDLVRRLVNDLPRLLSDGGFALLELGENQADTVATLASAAGLEEQERIRDIGGCDRILVLGAVQSLG